MLVSDPKFNDLQSPAFVMNLAMLTGM